MNPVSEDLKDWFEDSTIDIGEFNAVSGWSIHVGSMPDAPDTCIAIYDGPSRVRSTQGRTNAVYYSRVQIRVRSTTYLEGYEKAQAIVNVLEAICGKILSLTKYGTFRELTGPSQLPRDEQSRFLWSVNAEAVRFAV